MNDYKQDVRDLIFKRESEGKSIHEIAEEIEKIIREQVAREIQGNPQLRDFNAIHNHTVGEVCPTCTRQSQAINDARIARGDSK